MLLQQLLHFKLDDAIVYVYEVQKNIWILRKLHFLFLNFFSSRICVAFHNRE